jgi:hypothetical protein
MAHTNPTSSRAMATTTWLACFPRAISLRYRLQRLPCAFPLMAWRALGCFASLSWRCRLTFAGYRYAQAPSTRARRAWVLPALVMAPCRRRSPVEYSEGMRPMHLIAWHVLLVCLRGNEHRVCISKPLTQAHLGMHQDTTQSQSLWPVPYLPVDDHTYSDQGSAGLYWLVAVLRT